MREYFRYVRGDNGKGLGSVKLIEKDGWCGLGFAVCNPEDRFDKAQAKSIAHDRASFNLENSPFSFYDMVDGVWYDEMLEQMPQSASRRDVVDEIFGTMLDIVEDLKTDYARSYARQFDI